MQAQEIVGQYKGDMSAFQVFQKVWKLLVKFFRSNRARFFRSGDSAGQVRRKVSLSGAGVRTRVSDALGC